MVIKHLPDFNLTSIMRSGQCFRLTRLIPDTDHAGAESYRLIAHGRVLEIKDLSGARYAFHCTEKEYEKLWAPYFDLDEDYRQYCADVDKTDAFLIEAIRYGQGIKILRQEPWETLVSFIISQRKNIQAIRKAVEILCETYGDLIGVSGQDAVYCFPNPQQLKAAGIEGLKDCGLGYRAKYVHDAATKVTDGEIDLQGLSALNNNDMRAVLKTIFGVGDKIADCVMLYAYHRLDVFPVDVWIDRVVKEKYDGQFPLAKYGATAGVLQLYLFYYALNGGLKQ